MPQFVLKITMGNDAMCSTEDISDALCKVVENITYHNFECKNIRDVNGNIVGFYQITD